MKTKYFSFIKCIVILILVFLACAFWAQNTHNNPTTVKAYTEEQKQQAKAWLSAHGYAPTRAGAAQAYADYKSGKLKLSEAEKKLAGEKTGVSTKKKSKKKQKVKAKKKTKKKSKEKKKTTSISSPTSQPGQPGTDKNTEKTVSQSSRQIEKTGAPSSTSEPERNKGTGDNTLPKENGSDKIIYYVIAGIVVLLIISLICVVVKRKGKEKNE